MAEFASISSLLREKCEENTDLQKYCQTIAAKYLDFAKRELHAQYAREENIMLKMDIGNLQSIYRTVTENNEAQAELDALLMEYYDEHLKSAFDIDECELEKLASYDEIKLELETRDSINMYQRLYECKIETAKKMEERNIVKKYRQAEQEYSKTKTERLHLEEKVTKLKAKTKQFMARRQEESKLILQLVEGSIELETIFADLYPQKLQSQVKLSGTQRLSEKPLPDLNIEKVGLSSRLLVNFEQFKIPSIPSMSKFRQINHRKGLNRLLQQSEVIRKSMQSSPIVLSDEFATQKLPGILKIADDVGDSRKTVSFGVHFHKDEIRSIETQEVKPCDTLDQSYSENVDDSEMEACLIENELKPAKIDITENLLIKPADKIIKDPGAQPKGNIKRKANNEDSKHEDPSPAKIKCSPSKMSNNIDSKSFMDMFLDFSKDTIEESSLSSIKNVKEVVKLTPENEKAKEIKEKKPIDRNDKELMQKKDTNPKTKSSTKQFDGFEEFISKFDDNTSVAKENEEPIDHDMSFQFSQGNDDDGTVSQNNYSFDF